MGSSDAYYRQLSEQQAAEITRLKAVIAAEEWRPIETAPKDGTYILFAGSNFDGGMAVVHWDGDWWMLDDGKNFEIALRAESKLTHWRPLPEPPAALSEATPTEGEGFTCVSCDPPHRVVVTGLPARARAKGQDDAD